MAKNPQQRTQPQQTTAPAPTKEAPVETVGAELSLNTEAETQAAAIAAAEAEAAAKAEAEALAAQEAEAAAKAAAAAAATPAPVAAPAVEQLKVQESTTFVLLREELAAYAAGMGRSVPQTGETAAKWQKRLYGVYSALFNLGGYEFRNATSLLIETFRANESGAFSEAMVNRGIAFLALPPAKVRMFSHLNHLFTVASDVGPKRAGKELDLTVITKELPSEEARQFVLQYFR